MTHSVVIATPIPTLEEFGKSLGISKARQKALMRIITGTGTGQQPGRKGSVTSLRKSGRRGAKRR
jgi:hypothetical protein